MIQINRDDLPQIALEFDDYLSDYLIDKRSLKKKALLLDKWIKDAKNKGDTENLNYASMLEFYKKFRPNIAKINSVRELRKVNAIFFKRFRIEILEWKIASSKDKSKKAFGMFSKKMVSLYNGFITSNIIKINNNLGYWLSKRLDIRTCPYCNRHYTITVVKTKSHTNIRPQFDHFLPKYMYPLTAICFYNLVPCCADCNKTKLERIIKIHPYEDCFENHNIQFEVNLSNYKIHIKNGCNVSNVSNFALEEIYANHSDIAKDIVSKSLAYNSGYYNQLIDQFSGIGLTQSDIEKMVWGNTLSINDDLSRPFSKFTRDICKQLGIKVK